MFPLTKLFLHILTHHSLLFAGLLINRETLGDGLSWLLITSISHAAFEALAINELQYLQLKETKVNYSCFFVPSDIQRRNLVRRGDKCTSCVHIILIWIPSAGMLIHTSLHELIVVRLTRLFGGPT